MGVRARAALAALRRLELPKAVIASSLVGAAVHRLARCRDAATAAAATQLFDSLAHDVAKDAARKEPTAAGPHAAINEDSDGGGGGGGGGSASMGLAVFTRGDIIADMDEWDTVDAVIRAARVRPAAALPTGATAATAGASAPAPPPAR